MEDNVHRPGPLDARPKATKARPAGALRRLLPSTKPYRFRFALSALVTLGVLSSQVAQPEVVKRFIDEVLEGGRSERLMPYALTSLSLGVLWTVMAFTRRNVLGSVALGLEYDLRNRVYAYVQGGPEWRINLCTPRIGVPYPRATGLLDRAPPASLGANPDRNAGCGQSLMRDVTGRRRRDDRELPAGRDGDET